MDPQQHGADPLLARVQVRERFGPTSVHHNKTQADIMAIIQRNHVIELSIGLYIFVWFVNRCKKR